MELITILVVIGLFFGIIPGVDECTLDAADCAIIEEAGANMRKLSSLTIDELTFVVVAGSANGDIGEELTFSGSGQMAWNDRQVEMNMDLGFADAVSEEHIQFVVKDGTAYTYDATFEEWEQQSFILDVRNLPTLAVPESEWSGSDGVYTLTLTSDAYLTSNPFIEMTTALFNVLGIEEDIEALTLQLRDFFGQISATDVPYTITYTIEDGFVTQVHSEGTYNVSDDETTSPITFGMTLAMSNHNGEVTIEAPEIKTSFDEPDVEPISFDDPAFTPYADIPLASEGMRDIRVADDVAAGVVRGVTEEGFPFIGSPDAPITIAEFADFSCPHCADFLPEWERLIAEFVRSGQLRVIYIPLTFVGGEFSVMSAFGAICATEQGAFWEYHHVLYNIQQSEGSTTFTLERMDTLAAAFGLDGEAFTECTDSAAGLDVLQAADALSQELGVNATPTLIFRLSDGEWQRFLDDNGEPLSRQSYEYMSELIADNQ